MKISKSRNCLSYDQHYFLLKDIFRLGKGIRCKMRKIGKITIQSINS